MALPVARCAALPGNRRPYLQCGRRPGARSPHLSIAIRKTAGQSLCAPRGSYNKKRALPQGGRRRMAAWSRVTEERPTVRTSLSATAFEEAPRGARLSPPEIASRARVSGLAPARSWPSAEEPKWNARLLRKNCPVHRSAERQGHSPIYGPAVFRDHSWARRTSLSDPH